MVNDVFSLVIENENEYKSFIEEMVDDFIFDWYKVLGVEVIPDVVELLNFVYSEVELASTDIIVDLEIKRQEEAAGRHLTAQELLELYNADKDVLSEKVLKDTGMEDLYDRENMVDFIIERIEHYNLMLVRSDEVYFGNRSAKEFDVW